MGRLMNRPQKRSLVRPWRFTARVRIARAIKKARMPKDYYAKARALREEKKRAFRARLGLSDANAFDA